MKHFDRLSATPVRSGDEGARGVQSAQGRSAGRVEALVQSMLSSGFNGELKCRPIRSMM